MIRCGFYQFFFDFDDIFARCQSCAVGDAEDVGIDGDGGLAEGGVEYDVGGFAADAGQGFEGFAIFGDVAFVFFD